MLWKMLSCQQHRLSTIGALVDGTLLLAMTSSVGSGKGLLRQEALTSSESMPVFCLATMAGFRDAMRDVTAICTRTSAAFTQFAFQHNDPEWIAPFPPHVCECLM